MKPNNVQNRRWYSMEQSKIIDTLEMYHGAPRSPCKGDRSAGRDGRSAAELFCRGNFPPGGAIITVVITNDPLIGRGSISINIFTSTISSKTVHLLYPIFVPKP